MEPTLLYAARVDVIIRFVLVATALYRYIHWDVELLGSKGKIMNLRRDLCLLTAPTKSFSKL